MTNLKLGAFYNMYSFKGNFILVRPIEETMKNVTFYSINSDSIFTAIKPVKNKIEFHKDAIKEELKQFRKCINNIYKDKHGIIFTGTFHLDSTQQETTKLSTEYLNLSSNPKALKKKIKEDIQLAIESKNILDKQYREAVSQYRVSTIKSERYNINQRLKIIRDDRKKSRDRVKILRQQWREI